MKERENELTIRPNLTNLETGDIFMSEGGDGPKPDEKEVRKAWDKALPVRNLPVEIRKARESAIKEGVVPEVTPVEDKPQFPHGDELSETGNRVADAIADDIELVYDHSPEQLTEDAEKYLQKILESKRGAEGLKINQEILTKNGISRELIEKYAKDKPEVLIAMLAARSVSVKDARRQARRDAEHKGKAEQEWRRADREADERASSAGGGKGGDEKPPAPPEGTPSAEEPEDSSRLTTEGREIFDRLKKHQAERRTLYTQFEAQFEALSKNQDFVNELKKAGFPEPSFSKVFGDPETFEENYRRAVLQSIREGEDKAIYVPESLEEVVKLIMNRAAPEYRVDRGDGQRGEKCLINTEGTVNTVNVLDWARDNLFKAHQSNPTAEVSFFNDIATNVKTEGFGSVIGFYELTFTDSYFLEEVRDPGTKEVLKDENGRKVTKVSAEYQALKNQMLMEVFLLQLRRNPAVLLFVQNRGEREKFINTLASAFALNPDTRGDFLVTTLTAPSMVKTTAEEAGYNPDQKEEGALLRKLDVNFAMGDATRQALAAYMHIYDYEQLVKILGKDSTLFQYEYEGWDLYEATPTGKIKYTPEDVGPKTPEDIAKSYSRKDVWFYTKADVEFWAGKGITVKEGEVKLYKLKKNRQAEKDRDGNLIVDPINGAPHHEFMKRINVFDSPTPEQRDMEEIRERIRQSIMKTHGISYREAELAELQAFSMGELNGVFAKVDTEAVTHEWWSRLLNFYNKRQRERAESRHSAWGSMFNLEGFRRIGLNVMEGVRDIRGRSLQKIVLGGEGRDIDIRKPLKNTVEFERTSNGFVQFVDKEGNNVEGPQVVSINVVSGQPRQEGDVDAAAPFEYKNDKGALVEVGDLRPKLKVKAIEDKIEFDVDAQKQYVVNHVLTGTRIYEWIMESLKVNPHELVSGTDIQGNPIKNDKLINEIKDKIQHDLRYMLSTHQEISYDERTVEPKRIYRRNEKTRMLETKKGESLDEEWYVIGKNGKRTKRHGVPEQWVEPTEMTRFESMFGAPAAKYIQAEIEARGLDVNPKDPSKNIFIQDPRTGEKVRVNLTMANASEFRTAVWLGAFDYQIASEFESHRTAGSGDRRYDYTLASHAKDGLIYGDILDPWQVEMIMKATKTTEGRLIGEDLGMAIMFGGTPGLLKALRTLAGGVVS